MRGCSNRTVMRAQSHNRLSAWLPRRSALPRQSNQGGFLIASGECQKFRV